MTAYMGLLEIGKPAAGETVVVAAASGATTTVRQRSRLEQPHVGGRPPASRGRRVRSELVLAWDRPSANWWSRTAHGSASRTAYDDIALGVAMSFEVTTSLMVPPSITSPMPTGLA